MLDESLEGLCDNNASLLYILLFSWTWTAINNSGSQLERKIGFSTTSKQGPLEETIDLPWKKGSDHFTISKRPHPKVNTAPRALTSSTSRVNHRLHAGVTAMSNSSGPAVMTGAAGPLSDLTARTSEGLNHLIRAPR